MGRAKQRFPNVSVSTPPSLSAFHELCSQTTSPETYPLASSIQKDMPLYDACFLSVSSPAQTSALQDEWYDILLHGPGVFPSSRAKQPAAKATTSPPAAATPASGTPSPSHCPADPASFLAYYSSPWLALVCAAHLDSAYRVTTQLNVVKPGGASQAPHRDYHLGFETTDAVAACPRATHKASALLTLQGAAFDEGFVAYRLPEFADYLATHYVALPLSLGDAVFFSPALFQAAGANALPDLERSANLIQASSAFGKTMETVEALPLVEKTWETLREKYGREGMSREVSAFVAAVAEGYRFPTNLDRRPPVPGGMALESEQQLLMRGLEGGWGVGEVVDALKATKEASGA
ncbi:phytanoyl-CoA dioxygenase-like protein [Cryomyces antarcticus]